MYLLLFIPVSLLGQGGLMDEMKSEEELLKASTKQLNQFFRRFNGEEDENGNRYYPSDRKYRDVRLRRKYFPILFRPDSNFDRELLLSFVTDMTDKNDPVFINLHTPGLVAEVKAQFKKGNRNESVFLYMLIQPQGKGYEWVISDVYHNRYEQTFDKKEGSEKPFIHPMSHELTFMNLNKAFRNGRPESYTLDSFSPDYLSIFLYEMNTGVLGFETVEEVKFHLFGISGWYIEITNYNQVGGNSGWLISNLAAVNDDEKDRIREYVYGK